MAGRIEGRTAVTLMSKPVKKWEVLVGKYLGIILAALVAVAVLGVVLILATHWRIPGDYQIRATTLDDRELAQLSAIRAMHIAGLIPSLLLVWLQISVLAAIGVALSTRFSLVVNLPGSTGGVRDALAVLAEVLPHALDQVRGGDH